MRVICEGMGAAVWQVTLTGERVALDGPGLGALHQALSDAAEGDCRVLLLRGQPEIFCAGMDLDGLDTLPLADVQARCEQFTACLELLSGGAFFSVALVRGAATGGGVGLAAACDLVLAAGDATFTLPELTLGLIPAMVLPVLTRRLPRQKARLLALGGALDAAGALQLGLVDEVAPDGAALGKAARRWLRQALRCQPEAVAALEALDGELEPLPLADALERSAAEAATMFCDPETRARVRAFLDGDLPDWFARPPKIELSTPEE